MNQDFSRYGKDEKN